MYRHLKLSKTLEHSVCYCYTSYEMTDQYLWFQVQINNYSKNWNTPYCHSWGISKMQSGREDTLEKWYAIKFCFKLGKKTSDAYWMLQTAFGASCMNQTSVFEWHKRFKEGRESVRDDERCGRSKEVNTPELIGQIENFMDKDRRMSIETISAQLDVSVGTVHTIIREEQNMEKICAKFVPRVLREDQKERRFHNSREMVELINSDPAVLDGSMLALPDPRRSDRANPPTNFWWSLFFTALAWSTCTGFPLDRQSTRNTMLRF